MKTPNNNNVDNNKNDNKTTLLGHKQPRHQEQEKT